MYDKERTAVSEEEQVAGTEQEGDAAGEPAAKPAVEEIKVQAEDLFKTINDIVREGSARRVIVMRNDRTLIDIPLAFGIGASVVLAIYMPILSAMVGVGALLGGCTVRIERDEVEED
jgi:hypothetical protein